MTKLIIISVVSWMLLLPGNIPVGATSYPQHYFRSPVDFPIALAGSFGELRKNHFHSGIDIRTGGKTGKPVFASADGYIARVFVSPAGFGKALYIAHANGYTTVYGHLLRFNGAVGNWIARQQYSQESFALDMQVPKGLLKVKKGEVIALSGNSGASGGPHLHFEVRESASQEVINPLEFGFDVPDNTPPKITAVKIYPFDAIAMVNYTDKALMLGVTGGGGKYSIKTADTVKVTGNIIFGLETTDFSDNSGMKNGVPSVALTIDNEQVYSHHLEKFAFANTRYVNSLVDYPLMIHSNRKIQRSYIAPNNKNDIYGKVKNNGIINFSDNRAHKIVYIVTDLFGNASYLVFWVKSHPPAGRRTENKIQQGVQMMHCLEENHFARPDIVLDIPKDALYEDLDFEYYAEPQVAGTYARLHRIHNGDTPLHVNCSLAIKPGNLPKELMDKAVIVAVEPGHRFYAKGGVWEKGFLKTQIRDFGDYSIAVDTEPPVIRPVNVKTGKNLNGQGSIMLKITDNLAGIKSYRGTMNGKWILMDYDAKNNLLTYLIDEHMPKGKNNFLLVVTDGVGNQSRYDAVFLR
ncbi:MAG: M23 family metallopeptidase [Bacteroidetes bacterium]|nr:M23 family metallopeptidase [Bacteroidota bacterium]